MMPEGWERKELGSVIADIKGGGTPSKKNPDFWDGDIPWASVKDITAQSVDATQDYITEAGLKDSASNLIPANTVIVATRMAVGKTIRFNRDVAINQDLKALFPKKELSSDYLYHWLASKESAITGVSSGSTVQGTTICKIRNITDPDFWQDFEITAKPEEEIRTAAIRKCTEMKKVMTSKMEENPLRYAPFSEKVMEVLKRFQQGQLDAANVLKEYETIANELNAEEQSYKNSGLDQRAYGVLKLLEAFDKDGGETLKQLARDIDALYVSDQTAPKGWQSREQLRKDLRQQVREKAHGAGIAAFKDVPAPVEEYALKHYTKVA